MRFGVISDVHANLHALDASLKLLEAERVDGYICAGDLVGYGPFPNECIRRVRDLGAHCVAGNHDLIALERLSDDRCVQLARQSLRWTRTVLDDDSRDVLASLPREVIVGEIAVFHGSIGDPQAYVHTAEQALTALRRLDDAAPGCGLMIVGHTHHPMAVAEKQGRLLRAATGEFALPPGERVLLNPGAVGQSRDRTARAHVMVLDVGARTASFQAVAYDVAACRRALRDRGLPDGSHHLRPSRWRVAARRAKHGVRRMIGSRATAAR
jgi:predicted phosphodiesterase